MIQIQVYWTDIGADMNKLKGHEEIFYDDQKGARKCRISQEIDIEYVMEQERIQSNETIERERQQLEEDFIMDVVNDEADARDELNSTSNDNYDNQSLNRSGLA